MRVLHVCLAVFYIDKYGYQENILPKMHQLQGHDVKILASTETFIDNMNLGYIKANNYFTETNIPISRIPYIEFLPHFIVKKLRIYKNVYKSLDSFKPDIIFLHDVQFLSIITIIKYLKKNKDVIIYADGHTDFNVSARNWLSKNILHKVIYRFCAKLIEPYLKYFYGVLPIRNDFIRDVYKISPKKIKLLVMGGDTSDIDFTKKDDIKNKIRISLKISKNDFLIITGGKIDKYKNIPLLIRSIVLINNPNIKLIVFGSMEDNLHNELNDLINHECIRYVGWKSQRDISDLFLSSDLAFFPGRHSVLWEHSIALGIPGVFKKWDGINHVDLGGNCIFLDEISPNKIIEIITKIYLDKKLYNKMLDISIKEGIPYFSYYEIAKRAIEL